MALTDRKLIRAEVSALFDGITELQANYAYPVLELGGLSPVMDMHSDGTRAGMISASVNRFDHYFKLGVYVNRTAHGAEEAENLLDSIYTQIMQECRDHITGTLFMELVVDDERSQPQFAVIDGIPYRLEEIGLYVRSNASG